MLLRERTMQYETELQLKRRAAEQNSKSTKDLEKWRSRAEAATAVAHGKGRYVETDNKFDKEHMQRLEVRTIYF